MPMPFKDRRSAGRALAEFLAEYEGYENCIVLGLLRGGVPVAYEVARRLGIPLDVFVVRKLGVPGQEELAMGAIATGGARVLNQDVIRSANIPQASLDAAEDREREELQRRETLYRGARGALDLSGKVVILVDDGLATGATMRVAVQAARQQGPDQIIVAVPTAPAEVCTRLKSEADDVICLLTPRMFGGVGRWYQNFDQTTDAEVRELLSHAPASSSGHG
ncbi:MAG: phosphoribosyltransferase [Anaerolineales bacterium]